MEDLKNMEDVENTDDVKNTEVVRKRKDIENREKDIVFSRTVKAGKRIYYLDVKKSRKDELYLAITESKKIVTGEGEDAQVNYEKHKIFLYKEDFDKFCFNLIKVLEFIKKRQPYDAPDFEEEEEEKEEGFTVEGASEEGTTTEETITKEETTAEEDTINLDEPFKIDIDF
jgi:hypothetical protein